MPLKPIAVVADNISTALDWLRKQYGDEIRKVNMQNRRIDLYNGMTYVIVINKEQARGFEFSSMVVAPDYESLIDTVKRRIR